MNCARALRMLDAYVDRELDARTAAEVAAHLHLCTACAAAHDRRLALRSVLADGAFRYRAPGELRQGVVRDIARLDDPRRSAQPGWWQLIAASAATAVAGVTAGWWLAQPQATDSLREYVVAQHVAALAPGGPRIDIASSDRHTVKPWFQGRIDYSPAVRDLSSHGFELLGARIDRLGDRQAVAIVYRLRSHVIDVYAWQASPAAVPREREETLRGFHVLTWADGDIGYAAVTDADRAELRRFEAAYRTP